MSNVVTQIILIYCVNVNEEKKKIADIFADVPSISVSFYPYGILLSLIVTI